jgi:hypothetical protein
VPDISDLPEFRVPLHAGRLPRAHADAATAAMAVRLPDRGSRGA